jgi:hypothetical protein
MELKPSDAVLDELLDVLEDKEISDAECILDNFQQNAINFMKEMAVEIVRSRMKGEDPQLCIDLCKSIMSFQTHWNTAITLPKAAEA